MKSTSLSATVLIRRARHLRFAAYGALLGVLLSAALVLQGTAWAGLALLLLTVLMTWIGFDFYRSVIVRLAHTMSDARSSARDVRVISQNVGAAAARDRDAHSRIRKIEEVTAQARRASELAVYRPVNRSRRSASVLFVTSNGSGMGHLTRLMAIAEAGRKDFQSQFLSLSSAAGVAADRGYTTFAVESQSRSGLGWSEWNRQFSEVFADVLHETRPAAVAFDGVQIFRGLTERTRAASIPLAWICRGLWKENVPRDQLVHWRDFADQLILPTEGSLFAAEHSIPASVADGCVVLPIVMTTQADLLSRDDACRALGLRSDHKNVLIQLGSGALQSREEMERVAVASVRALGGNWNPVVLRSPLTQRSETPEDPTRVVLRKYPVAPAIRAFEFSITAAGYNTVHENIVARHPGIYCPDASMLADDQAARAASVASKGGGFVATTLEELAEGVKRMARSEARELIKSRLTLLDGSTGNAAAAAVLSQLARGATSSIRLSLRRIGPVVTKDGSLRA